MSGIGNPQPAVEASFSVSINDKVSRRANALDLVLGLVGGLFVMGLGLALLVFLAVKGYEPAFFFGPLLILLGGWLFTVILRQATGQLDRVEINQGGVGFYFGKQPPRLLHWNEPSLRVKLYDYRGKNTGIRNWYKIPCMVSARGLTRGLSGEASDAIESAARRAGLEISIKEDSIVRRVTIRSH